MAAGRIIVEDFAEEMHKLLIQHLPPRVKDARKTPVSVVVLLYEGRRTRDFSIDKTSARRLIAVDWSDMRTKTIQGGNPCLHLG